MCRRWHLAALCSCGCALSLVVWLTVTTGAQDPDQNLDGNGKKAADSPLPIRHVVLFNSGVGYFQREGAVEGNAQVELSFPVSDKREKAADNAEKTRSHYRFTVIVAAGKTASYDVLEQQARVDTVALAGAPTPFYAIGAGIAVKPVVYMPDDKLVGLKIDKGMLIPVWKSRQARTYYVQNLSSEDRSFTVDHIIRDEWARIDPKGEPQAGPGVHRFKLDVAKGKTASQQIVEERVHAGKGTWLKTAPEDMLREYLRHPTPSADVKAALTRTLMLQARAADAMKQAAELERQFRTAAEDQGRLRENLKIVPLSSEAYKKFLDKFVAQESEIETLQKNLRQTQAVLTSTQREFDVFLAALNVE